jgi:hypothetical protein
MTVNPGFAGQRLVPATLCKLADIRKLVDSAGYRRIELQVDGNVIFANIPAMIHLHFPERGIHACEGIGDTPVGGNADLRHLAQDARPEVRHLPLRAGQQILASCLDLGGKVATRAGHLGHQGRSGCLDLPRSRYGQPTGGHGWRRGGETHRRIAAIRALVLPFVNTVTYLWTPFGDVIC